MGPWGHLGGALRRSWRSWGLPGPSLGPPLGVRKSLGGPWAFLGIPRESLGRSWGPCGVSGRPCSSPGSFQRFPGPPQGSSLGASGALQSINDLLLLLHFLN